jgi:hypothetical protein
MPTTWFSSATFLPYPGEPIDFLLEERGEPIHGTFANGMFQSDLASYETGRVRSWRAAVVDPADAVPTELHVERRRAWAVTLKKLVSLFRGTGRTAAIELTAVKRPGFVARPVPPVGASSRLEKKPLDSNQLSS